MPRFPAPFQGHGRDLADRQLVLTLLCMAVFAALFKGEELRKPVATPDPELVA